MQPYRASWPYHQPMRRAGIVSYRLGGTDGVSIEAAKWSAAIASLGFDVTHIAGEGGGGVVTIEGLRLDDTIPVDVEALDDALAGLDLIIVENLCSLPLNPAATHAVAEVCRGRPTIMRHHDLAWQRADTAHLSLPADDPAWRHVTINQLSVAELASRGYVATCLYNRFDMSPPSGDRAATRVALGIEDHEVLVLQPTRALPRKNVPLGLALAESLEATFWLTGAAEDGFEPALEELIEGAAIRFLRGSGPGSIDDAYAAADVVVLPSTWEGFGNPAIEAITHRRPLSLARYPVALEILATGITAFDPVAPAELAGWLHDPDPGLLERNLEVARAHFDIADLPGAIAQVIDSL